MVVPPEAPPEAPQEEAGENFESFLKAQEEFAESGRKEEVPSQPVVEKTAAPEEEEAFRFSEQAFETRAPKERPEEFVREERAEVKPPRPKKTGRREKKGPSPIFAVIVILIVLVFGIYYLWTEFAGKVNVTYYLEYPVKKATALWDEIWGTKQKGLIVGDLNRYDEKVGEFSLSVIEGKVRNQSPFVKKYIKIRVVIFDRNKDKVAEKETLCGLSISRGELRNLPPEFFKGEMLIQPQTAKEMIIPTGRDAPFATIFKDLSSQAKEFKVEISEAPNL
jgi:hypothetical protein